MKSLSPFRLIIAFTIVSLIGIYFLPYLRIDLIPANISHGLTVKYTSASSAETNEQRITELLENYFSQIGQIKKIYSRSDQNGGTVILNFDPKADLEMKRFEIAMMIERLYPELPDGVSYPTIEPTNTTSRMDAEALKVYMVNSNRQSSNIREIAERLIIKELYKIKGIKEVELSGTPPLEIAINYDATKCKLLNIQPAQIVQALKSATTNTFPGVIEATGGHQIFLRVKNSVSSPDLLGELLISRRGAPEVRLKDLSEIEIMEQAVNSYYRINGNNAINIVIYAKPDQNALSLARQIDRTVLKINKRLPPGYSLKPVYDKTGYLSRELSKHIQRIALSCLILTIFILLFYRSFKAVLILISSLIVNLCITTLLVILFKVDINLYAIGGITIAFGIMVDNSIVILDHFMKYKNRKILPAMAGATFSIISALLMVFLLPEELKLNLQDFSMVIILSLLTSILVALGYTPALYSLLTRKKGLNNALVPRGLSRKNIRSKLWLFRNYEGLVTLLTKRRGTVVCCFIVFFGIPVFLLPNQINGAKWYIKLYNSTFGSPIYTENIRPVADKFLGGGLRLFYKNLSERAGIRSPEQEKLFVTCNMGSGNTSSQMNELFKVIEKYLAKVNGVDKFITYIQDGYYGGIEIFIKKTPYDNRFAEILKSRLIKLCSEMEGVKWHVFGHGNEYSSSTSTTPKYTLVVKGYNYDGIEKQVQFLNNILKSYRRISNINLNERYKYTDNVIEQHAFQLINENLAVRDLNQRDLYTILRSLSEESSPVAEILNDGGGYPIYLRRMNWEGRSFNDFLDGQEDTDSLRPVRLRDLGTMKQQPGNSAIYRENREYIRVVSYDYLGEQNFGNRHMETIIKEANQALPVGYHVEKHAYDMTDSRVSQQLFIILVLIGLNYGICCIILESLLQPLLIIGLIPLSFIGVFYVLGTGAFPIDQGAYASFIMLGGLVTNAGIFLINDYNKLQTNNPRRTNRNIAKAFFTRSRPIILTIVACCCGLLPFLVDGPGEVFWFSFAISTLSGLLFSFISLFIFLPAMMGRRR